MEINAVSGVNVNQIELFYRVLEKRGRFYYEMLPFNSLPLIMVVHLMKKVFSHINTLA